MKHKLLRIILICLFSFSMYNTYGADPVTPNASREARALLNYIYSQYGKKTLSGQMWAPWAKQDEIQTVFEITGKYPALRGQDYIHERSNKRENALAIEWWKAGGIPTIMWHWGAPSKGEGYEQSKMAINIDSCFIPGTMQYNAMWSDLKRIADHLTELRDANVPVLWRPMHECDGNWFWYGKQGGERFVKLWKTMFDYFTKERKLNNLIWVLCHTGDPSAEWDPGKAYYDIAGGDTYNKGIQGPLFNKLKAIHGETIPIPFHECGTLPDPDECFKNGVTWSWWMLWHTGHLYNHNKDELKRIYNHALVITRDELPNIMDYLNMKGEPLPVFPETTSQLYNEFLTSVPDIQVETVVGYLPGLPRYVKGVYKNNFSGPDVRVLWPAPLDNSQVLTPGTYTVTGKVAGTDLQPKAIVTVKVAKARAAPDRTLEVFRLDQVILNTDLHDRDTKFIMNRDKFLTGLVNTNPDNFLYMFRNAFGQKQPEGAKPMGGWDSQLTKLRGHATGHYLTAIAQAYGSTGYDPSLQANFAARMEYMVNTLYELSQMSGLPKTSGGENVSDPTAVTPGPGKSGFDSDLSVEGIRTDYWNWGKGFISAYPPDQFIMLEKGATYGGSSAQIWAPYYTLHKNLAGLMDIYEISGNEKALEIVKGMGNWVYERLNQLPKETLISMWNRYIAGEYGGMNEAMARLYRITNEPRYLEAAQLFDNVKVFFGDAEHSHGLAKNVDLFRGLHANQHIPQVIGALETYRVSDTPEYYFIADNFWNIATNDYMYSIGGVAGARNPNNAECFIAQPATLYENGFASGGQNETCATYNMLKLTRDLFLFDQRAEYMDYYERGLYNHILASVAENTPANTYHVPLRPGSVKQFGNPNMTGFTCCNGTALESNTKLQNSIYFKSADNKALYVNLYVPSTLKWTDRNVTVTQTTAYPKEDHTKLTIKGNGRFDINVRVPHWATNGFFVKINGKVRKIEAEPGSYLTISRKWKDGDTVELQMPFKFYLEPVMDQQNIASLFYGPVLLAAQESEPTKEWRKVTLNAKDISKSISGDAEQLQFNIDGVVFKPFYETYGRYSVYLDVTLK